MIFNFHWIGVGDVSLNYLSNSLILFLIWNSNFHSQNTLWILHFLKSIFWDLLALNVKNTLHLSLQITSHTYKILIFLPRFLWKLFIFFCLRIISTDHFLFWFYSYSTPDKLTSHTVHEYRSFHFFCSWTLITIIFP